jgi:hypothetical protein
MEILSNSVVEEVHAVILGISHSFTLDCTSNGVEDVVVFFSGEEIGDLTGRQKIIEVDQESLVGNLTFSEEEHKTLISDTGLEVEFDKIGLEIIHTIGRGDHDTNSGIGADEGTQSGERLLTGTTNTDKKGVTLVGSDDSGDLTGVLHGIFEENEVHDGVDIIVLSQGKVEHLGKSLSVLELIIELLIKTTDEVGEDEGLRSSTEVLLER